MSDLSLPSDECKEEDGSSCVFSEPMICLQRENTSTTRKSCDEASRDVESNASSSSSSSDSQTGRRRRKKVSLGWPTCIFSMATLVLLGGTIIATVIVFLSNPGLELDASSSLVDELFPSELPTTQPTDFSTPWKQLGVDLDVGLADSYRSVSLSNDGTTVAINTMDSTNLSQISTRVYRFSELTQTWNQFGEDLASHSNFTGRSVCLSSNGTVVAIASYFKTATDLEVSEDVGSIVRVYEWSFSKWMQLGSDIHSHESFNISDSFDWTIDLSADASTLAIGAPGRKGYESTVGEVIVFRWSGLEWDSLGTSLHGREEGDRFGSGISLAQDGKYLAIGAPGDGFGRVEVLKLVDGRWMQHGKEIKGDVANESIGYDVSIGGDGNTVAIGSPFADPNGEDSGRVRVYLWSGIFWFPTGLFEGSAAGENLGSSVSLSAGGETIAIGSPGDDNGHGSNTGKISVYRWKEKDLKWQAAFDAIEGSTAEEGLGTSLSVSDDGRRLALIGIRNSKRGFARVIALP